MPVGDTDSIRRQNRALVLGSLRQFGPISRSRLALETGLSNATISAISNDMISQNILVDLQAERSSAKTRGRPSVQVGFCRSAGYAILVELDVNLCRCSLIDYAGTLMDRVQEPLERDRLLAEPAGAFLAKMYRQIIDRNPETENQIIRIAVSVQGVLDQQSRSLMWSPIGGIAGSQFADTLETELGIPVSLYKRGQLLAQGTKRLYPDLQDSNVATIIVGSTVGMGISGFGSDFAMGTEFGHMNHMPDGALCRCGMRGCIEAYAADYGVLRSTYGVPEKTSPASTVPVAEYLGLIERARHGDRDATHAFHLAGRAIGYGIGRLMTVFDPSHVIIVGPGAEAFDLMEVEMHAAVGASFMSRVRGALEISQHRDESEPVFRGLADKALSDIDQMDFSPMPASGRR